jgi:hypothetical protein
LFSGGVGTFNNISSYDKGINGIMVDVLNTAEELTVEDFDFQVSIPEQPTLSWIQAPAPLSLTVRSRDGVGGADRYTLIWTDGAIKTQWLKVTLKAGAKTRLQAADTFYFGNLVASIEVDATMGFPSWM